VSAQPLPESRTIDYRTVEIVENVRLAERTCRARLRWPEAAAHFLPGQFMMLRLPGRTDPLLGRPFVMWDTWADDGGEPSGVEMVYEVVGKLTGTLSEMGPGQELEAWGPLGNGFGPPRTAGKLIMVAGGIGQTPFPALAKQYQGHVYGGREKVSGTICAKCPAGPGGQMVPDTFSRPSMDLLYGVRTASMFAGLDVFESLGVTVHKATDDGTEGHHGFVTALLPPMLEGQDPHEVHVVACGPEPMMAAAGKICAGFNVTCQVSLETRMACGFGACFGCVARTRLPGNQWDYTRVCLDGPVFDAPDVIF